MADVKAKVADYPFTTLVPNLASVSVGDYRFNVIDIPGLIEGASQGKGLGNAFLRHVLKSRVFAFVADLSRFESGIAETVELIDEIMMYLEQKFADEGDLQFSFREENGLIIFEVIKNDEIILTKKILFVLNKRDLINDEEILNEYKIALFGQINEFLSSKRLSKINTRLLDENCFVTSAGTYYGVGELLRKFAELLQKSQEIGYDFELFHQDYTDIEHQDDEQAELITEITDQEKPMLIEEGYINELESRFSKVWYIQHREICKMVFTIPRGNDEAENYFWQQMQSKGLIQILEGEGLMKGDVLKIRSYYEGQEDKYVLY